MKKRTLSLCASGWQGQGWMSQRMGFFCGKICETSVRDHFRLSPDLVVIFLVI